MSSNLQLVEDQSHPLVLIEDKSKEVPVVFGLDFNKAKDLTKPELRKAISAFEEELKKLPQVELPTKHYFSKGVYGREIVMPKGILVIGKIHKFNTMNVISSGEVSVLSIDGVKRFKAPYTFVSSPGAKRVIYAHDDVTWTCFHGTHETNVEKIEDEFIATNYEDIEALEAIDLSTREPKALSEGQV
jgi:hypothetical protein